MTAPLLEVAGLRKSYGDRVVLDGVDLTVAAHDVVCLIGSSGSGKSTLLRCLNLLEAIDDGVIRSRAGRSPTRGSTRARCAADRHGLPGLQPVPAPDGARQLHAGAAQGARGGQGRGGGRARELLGRFGLGEHAGDHPDRLSGGQQQRAALVRALCTQPRLLLLDEITAALDPELVGEVLEIVRDAGRGGMTMVLATHEMAFAREVATRVCFLDGGRILEQGPPEQIFSDPASSGRGSSCGGCCRGEPYSSSPTAPSAASTVSRSVGLGLLAVQRGRRRVGSDDARTVLGSRFGKQVR